MKINEDLFDLFIVGGGINGTGIARDATGRGLSVVLCEKDDLAEHTSSRSGKLIHGGLRYLEHYAFRLVREALIEREVLLESAPHIIWPLRFVLPVSPTDRHPLLIRFGLFLYDHLGGRKRLPGTRNINLRTMPEGNQIKDNYKKAFEFSDCWVDDARLVVLNAIAAAENGAKILTRTACTRAERENNHWHIETISTTTGVSQNFKARALINAGGPWVNNVIADIAASASDRKVRLVKGSHIIVKKFWDGDHAYLVQNMDKRVIFINPYEHNLALIGTTDINYDGSVDNVSADPDEIDYLLDVTNRYFKPQLDKEDVIQSFSGVRPLYDDDKENPSTVTRDYVLQLDTVAGTAPLLSIFGGKITTFRKLAEHALLKLTPFFPNMGGCWTAKAPLPGGDMMDADFDQFLLDLMQTYPWLTPSLAYLYARRYGTRTHALLHGLVSMSELGRQFGRDFFEREAIYLMDTEWATTPDDILQRRTKHGLHLQEEEELEFRNWFSGINAKAV